MTTATTITPEYIRYKLVNGTAESETRAQAREAALTAPAMSADTLSRIGAIYTAGGGHHG